MPELPEIYTIVEGMNEKLIGKTVKSVEVRVEKIVEPSSLEFKKGVQGAKIKDIRRFAKIIVVDLSNESSILIHLKLTGQLVFREAGSMKQESRGGHPSKAYEEPLPHKHTHVIFEFSDDSHLYFNDIRKFGYLKLVKTSEVEKRKEIKELGPEPLDGLKLEEFLEKLNRRPRSVIKQVLMDQKFISGIGNIYANEILFFAQARPDRKVEGLSQKEKEKIFKGISVILKKGIELGGSSENTYVNIEGKKGSFMDYAKVYQQKECKECGGKIEKITIGGRGTFYCPKCQK